METIYLGFFRGSYSAVARKFNGSKQSAKKVWKKFVDSGEVGPREGDSTSLKIDWNLMGDYRISEVRFTSDCISIQYSFLARRNLKS